MAQFSLNSTGGTLVLTVLENGSAKDISTATSISYMLRKPDQTIVELSAGFLSDGADGKVSYSWVSGDLNQEGWYSVQVKIVGVPWSGQSTEYRFEVGETFVTT